MSQAATSFTAGIDDAMRASPEPMPPAAISAIWMLSFAEGIASSLGLHRHGRRIPFADALFEIADVRKQRGAGGAEAEHSIFNHRLARADGFEEVAMVVAVIAVAGRRQILLFADGTDRVGRGTRRLRIFFVVLLQEGLLHGLRES